MPEDKLYPLRTSGAEGDDADYYAGALPDGRQGLMGPYDEEVVCVLFDGEGGLLGAQSRPALAPPDPAGKPRRKGRRPAPEPEERRAWAVRQALAWQAELGWLPSVVRVKRFRLPGHRIYVHDYPYWAIILRADPYYYSVPEEREDYLRMLTEWEASGNFVFWWGTDYQVGPDGEVLST